VASHEKAQAWSTSIFPRAALQHQVLGMHDLTAEVIATWDRTHPRGPR